MNFGQEKIRRGKERQDGLSGKKKEKRVDPQRSDS